MSNDAVVQVRIDPKVKNKAEKIFRRFGMSTSDAVRFFFSRTVEEKGIPFRSHVPNAETRRAIDECRSGGGEVVPMSELKRRILGKS